MTRRSIVVMGLMAAGAAAKSEAQFTGFVTGIERGTGQNIRVMVESHAKKMVRRHVLRVTAQTVIVKQEGQAEQPAKLDSLTAKTWVKVWFAGPEKDSYPLEVTARRIMIVDRP